MGKASNRKRARNGAPHRKAASRAISKTLPIVERTAHFFDGDKTPGPVFRFLKESAHVADFLNGKIWISTLETCRGYENPKQGDKWEGLLLYHVVDTENGSGDDPEFVELARRAHITVASGTDGHIFRNNKLIHSIPDAFVMCTTEEFSPDVLSDDFGRFCVEITHPREFFKLLTSELCKKYPISNFRAASVTYADPQFRGLESPPGELGFIKRPDRYSEQVEFRMLWNVSIDMPLTPFFIEIKELGNYCVRRA